MMLDNVSPFICEFWTLPAAAFLYSPANHLAATYAMINIEMHSQYIFSPSIYNWFLTHPVLYAVRNYDNAFQNIQDANSLVRVASSKTSLNGLILVMRNWN